MPRNSVRANARGASPVGNRMQVFMLANAGNRALFFPFGEGVGTTVSDVSGRAVDIPLNGTTAGVWASPYLGITPATNVDFGLTSAIAGLDMDFINSIYDCTAGFTDEIIYFGCEIGIAAAPSADTANYILSMGRRIDTADNKTGHLCVRINANRKVAWHLAARVSSANDNEYAITSSVLPTSGVQQSVFGFLLPGTSNNAPWYWNGALNATASFVGLNDAATAPKGESEYGISILGRIDSLAATIGSNVASGTVAPTIRNLILGRCSYNASNVTRLQSLAAYLHFRGRLPHWFAEID